MKRRPLSWTYVLGLLFPLSAAAFDSGSDGSDGALNPTVDFSVPLPASGVLNYTEVHIPSGVTVTFVRNAGNTPVRILASGDVSIDGTLDLSGAPGGTAADGGPPGSGGPGGYRGGQGGLPTTSGSHEGGDGFGPGGGEGAPRQNNSFGAGGSFATQGQAPSVIGGQGEARPVYGNAGLLPLIGGSGGGGGSGYNGSPGSGGGGGAGALLIAASGTLAVNGAILANGGQGGPQGNGGSGSGGAIRLMASTLRGEGAIQARGGSAAADGGDGRIRLEAVDLQRVSGTSPAYTFSTPGLVLVPNLPSIRISAVAGVTAPSSPSGYRDIELPGITSNPVSVELATSQVPVGTVITVTATPERGVATSASATVSGSLTSGTASTSIELPNGNSRLTAQTSFTITASLGADLSRYARGEPVERIRLAYVPGLGSSSTLIGASGRAYAWPGSRTRVH